LAGRRLADCESKDYCGPTTTMSSSSSDALRLFALLRRQQPLRRRDFRPPDAGAISQRRTRRQLHRQEAARTHRLRRAVQFERRGPSARTADQALEIAKEGAARRRRRRRSVRHLPKRTDPNRIHMEGLADPVTILAAHNRDYVGARSSGASPPSAALDPLSF
jgi:hypothetical protein